MVCGFFHFTLSSIFCLFFFRWSIFDILQKISNTWGLNCSSLDRYIHMFNSCFVLASAICYCFYICRQLLFTYTRFSIFCKTYLVAEALKSSSLDRYIDMFNSCFGFSRLLLLLYLPSIIVYVHRKQLILDYFKPINSWNSQIKCVLLHAYKKALKQLGWALFISFFCQFSNFFCFGLCSLLLFLYLPSIIVYVHRKQLILNY